MLEVIFLGLGFCQIFLFSNFALYLVRYLSPLMIRVLHLAFLFPESLLAYTVVEDAIALGLALFGDFPADRVPVPGLAIAVDLMVRAI
jgi:hypothetical protein